MKTDENKHTKREIEIRRADRGKIKRTKRRERRDLNTHT